jgi:hypothetical protein
MWICSKYGFFSIVQKTGCFHVRARKRRDLVNLAEACTLPESAIEEWPEADYRWRMRVHAPALRQIFELLSDIDYSNFKSEIASLPDQRDKLPAYHTLWANLAALTRTERVHPAEPPRAKRK